MQSTYSNWQKKQIPENLRDELIFISEDEKLIEDCFYQYVSFGTGGMRGLLGVGTNRINIYTIRRVSEGLARYIESKGEEEKRRGVVIAYDTRHFSKEFAMETASVLGAHGITSYIFKESRPTPQLSFAVRDLNAFAGVVITASHNPKQYNGFKVYGEDGAQLVPAGANAIVAHMDEIEDIFEIETRNINELELQGIAHWILEELDTSYLNELLSLKENAHIDLHLSIVYTPLHGSGLVPVSVGLRQFGFSNVHVVDEQTVQDGSFPTVSYPNPEEAEAFKLSIELGKRVGADLLLATDPDADRLGVAVRNGQSYELLTGNQLGSLLLDYLLKIQLENGELPSNGAIIKTIVTGELGAKIAAKYNIATVNTLTGFKYIAEKIAEYEESGEYSYLFGYEESYGYLIKTFARDKDAVQVALKVAEMTAYYAQQGKSLIDVLNELYKEFGYHKDALVSLTFEGKDGQEKMAAILSHLREMLPSELAGISVIRIEDYLTRGAILADGTVEDILLPQENVLKFVLENGSWVAIRPSGTEPKCKYYFGIVADSQEEAENLLADLKSAFL
ncbi:phospho-sugar mutase [Ureibacillus sp. GCM10028918]|uniref:phospho-sugar mutase n=1 Tax=Ureibacillus sp. GCM10028918 TaxID=3273429 RepID=UPI00361AB924